MMRVPPSDCPKFVAWSAKLDQLPSALMDRTPQGGVEKLRLAKEARDTFNDYVAALIAQRRLHVADDLVSMMAASELGKQMRETELMAHNTQLLFGGAHTTAKLMGHCLITLARHPDQRRRLRDDRSLIPQAIEEVLRYESVLQADLGIVAEDDAEIDGVAVPEGSQVWLMLGSANRDPSRWERPDEFDILRERKFHVGFGFGLHSCLGVNLARLEVELFLDRLLDRLPEWQMVREPEYGTNFFIRGPASIWIGKRA